jgi:YfiH family protein
MLEIIKPNWPAPKNVVAFTTTSDLNLGNPSVYGAETIAHNREILQAEMQLPNKPYWIKQTHSNIAIEIDHDYKISEADASYTTEKNVICTVLTADCLPVLVCNKNGTAVAAIHAGWRSLVSGIIENTLDLFSQPPEQLIAWLGPAIGPKVYEVGDEVRAEFLAHDPNAELSFVPSANERWLMDLYLLARQRLNSKGVTAIYGAEHCTYTENDGFFSHRRDPNTGRQATLIYIS